MVAIGVFFNTVAAKQLPMIEGIILVFHIFGFAAVLIVLWVLSPKITSSEVFGSFDNEGGWSGMGLSLLVGQVTAIYGLIGSDGAAHMAEETKEASIIVPRCMIWSYLLNGAMGFVMLVSQTKSNFGDPWGLTTAGHLLLLPHRCPRRSFEPDWLPVHIRVRDWYRFERRRDCAHLDYPRSWLGRSYLFPSLNVPSDLRVSLKPSLTKTDGQL